MRLPGRTAFVSARQIGDQADVGPRPYTLRAGGRSEQDEHAGLSVRKLVQLAGGDPDGVSFLAVRRADGTQAVLRRGDLGAPPPFPDGPPLVWVDSGSTHFLRPVRDGADENANDNIATPSGSDGPLVLSAHTGALLDVGARASPVRVRAGQPVRFTATVQGAAPGEQLGYAWDLGDGTAAHAATPTHSYPREGRYHVVLSVSGDHDAGGSSAVLTVQVGPRARAAGRGPGGGTNRRRDAARGGSTRGRPGGVGGAGRRRGGRGGTGPGTRSATPGRRGGGGGGPRPGAVRRIAPVAAAVPSSPDARPGSVAQVASTPTAAVRPASRGQRATAPGRRRRSPTTVGSTAPVSGLLLASATPLAPATPPGAPPPGGTAVAAARGGRSALPLGALAVAALVALGAASERAGRFRPRRRST